MAAFFDLNEEMYKCCGCGCSVYFPIPRLRCPPLRCEKFTITLWLPRVRRLHGWGKRDVGVDEPSKGQGLVPFNKQASFNDQETNQDVIEQFEDDLLTAIDSKNFLGAHELQLQIRHLKEKESENTNTEGQLSTTPKGESDTPDGCCPLDLKFQWKHRTCVRRDTSKTATCSKVSPIHLLLLGYY